MKLFFETNPYSCTACASITISKSIFQYFNFGMARQTQPVLVNPQYRLQYQGKILNIEAFSGPIIIKSSLFLNNTISIDNCEAMNNIEFKNDYISKY
jgi:hypothetical protein